MELYGRHSLDSSLWRRVALAMWSWRRHRLRHVEEALSPLELGVPIGRSRACEGRPRRSEHRGLITCQIFWGLYAS
jgi:hypothetical protein